MQRIFGSATLLALAIMLIGINLRPLLASLSPLVGQIQAASGLSEGGFALLTSVPTLLMGLLALLVGFGVIRLSAFTGCALALVLIIAACIARALSLSSELLMLSAVLAGGGIAIAQAFIPGVIKTVFAEKAGTVTALYTTSIMAGAAIASATTPLVYRAFDTQIALGVWAVPAAIALVVWVQAQLRGRQTRSLSKQAVQPIRKGLPIIKLCLLFGISTGGYVLVLAWLPAYYQQLGWSETASGTLLSALTGTEIIAGFLVAYLLNKNVSLRTGLLTAISAILVGLLQLAFAPEAMLVSCILCLGLGIGAMFPLSIVTTLEKASSNTEAGLLTAIVQGVGYSIAALFPLAAGIVNQYVTDLSLAWLGMLVVCVPLLGVAVSLFPEQQRQLAPSC